MDPSAFAAVVAAFAALLAPLVTWSSNRSRLVTLDRVAKARSSSEATSTARQALRELEDRIAIDLLERHNRPAYRRQAIIGVVLLGVGYFLLVILGFVTGVMPDDDWKVESVTTWFVLTVIGYLLIGAGAVFLGLSASNALDAFTAFRRKKKEAAEPPQQTLV
jgi:hypothetical protein